MAGVKWTEGLAEFEFIAICLFAALFIYKVGIEAGMVVFLLGLSGIIAASFVKKNGD